MKAALRHWLRVLLFGVLLGVAMFVAYLLLGMLP